MNRKTIIIISTLILVVGLSPQGYCFDSGSTGADGAFNPTANTELQVPDSGVFNFTTVNIQAGVTVTFKKNANNTPVYILATGDVTIAGTVSVNGQAGNRQFAGQGGPGGFDGGFGGVINGGKGLGTAAGTAGKATTSVAAGGGGGGYGAAGSNGSGGSGTLPGSGGGTYGSTTLLPIIGGSGGGGGAGISTSYTGGGGGGGGGALVIASSQKIDITGMVTANGGTGGQGTGGGVGSTVTASGGGGSGGAIRLIANTIAGNGTIGAGGGTGPSNFGYAGGNGGSGRIRIETNNMQRTSGTSPAYVGGWPTAVFISSLPTLRFSSIGGINVPANPSGQFGTPDVMLPGTVTNPVTLVIAATNIPIGTTVTVSAVPEYGSATTATSTALSGTFESSSASASIDISANYKNILTAMATYVVKTAMYWEGERIEKVRVASTLGEGSETVYITESGKEIKVTDYLARLIR